MGLRSTKPNHHASRRMGVAVSGVSAVTVEDPKWTSICFVLHALKNKGGECKFFFDLVTTQYDHLSTVKHVFRRIYVFSLYLGIGCAGGGGSPKGLVHNLLM